jgi:hypothetical protein
VSTRPPSGTTAPTVAEINGHVMDLVTLARAVCQRYYGLYPDEHERYGAAGIDWCHHDNQWLLSWAVGDVMGVTSLDEQACWLARVLDSRAFPVERLARNLLLAAEVVRDSETDPAGSAVAERLEQAAAAVDALRLG